MPKAEPKPTGHWLATLTPEGKERIIATGLDFQTARELFEQHDKTEPGPLFLIDQTGLVLAFRTERTNAA